MSLYNKVLRGVRSELKTSRDRTAAIDAAVAAMTAEQVDYLFRMDFASVVAQAATGVLFAGCNGRPTDELLPSSAFIGDPSGSSESAQRALLRAALLFDCRRTAR